MVQTTHGPEQLDNGRGCHLVWSTASSKKSRQLSQYSDWDAGCVIWI